MDKKATRVRHTKRLLSQVMKLCMIKCSSRSIGGDHESQFFTLHCQARSHLRRSIKIKSPGLIRPCLLKVGTFVLKTKFAAI